MNGFVRIIGVFLVMGLAANFSKAFDTDVETQAIRIFNRIAGTSLSLDDPRRPKMISLLAAGDKLGAIKIASDDDGFVNITVRQWAAPLSNRASDPLFEFNDFTAMVMGVTRDDRDFREILYGNFTYAAGPANANGFFAGDPSPYNNSHYANLDSLRVNFRRNLVRKEPQSTYISEASGVLTSRAWGKAHLEMGTNRRAIEFIFKQFMCTPLDEMRDSSMPDTFVRRDVDRSPGGNSQTYLNTCRSCHGGLDALAGAYAHLRFGFTQLGEGVIQEKKVTAKSNQNGNVYPAGHIVLNSNWENNFTANQNVAFGWRGEMKGAGISALGKMISESRGFSRCMAKRVFRQICYRSPDAREQSVIEEAADNFENGGYKMKALFEDIAVRSNCL